MSLTLWGLWNLGLWGQIFVECLICAINDRRRQNSEARVLKWWCLSIFPVSWESTHRKSGLFLTYTDCPGTSLLLLVSPQVQVQPTPRQSPRDTSSSPASSPQTQPLFPPDQALLRKLGTEEYSHMLYSNQPPSPSWAWVICPHPSCPNGDITPLWDCLLTHTQQFTCSPGFSFWSFEYTPPCS